VDVGDINNAVQEAQDVQDMFILGGHSMVAADIFPRPIVAIHKIPLLSPLFVVVIRIAQTIFDVII
jgi:hypothetical protein